MDHQLLARFALSALCILQGAVQLGIDTGRTHARNPLWARHARFHVVWQSVTVAGLAGIELALLWARLRSDETFYLAALLTAVSPLGFMAALATRRYFDSALHDPNGMRPVPLRVGARTYSVDMNVVAICAALVALAGIVLIYWS